MKTISLVALLASILFLNTAARADTATPPQWEISGGGTISYSAQSYGDTNGVSNSSLNNRTFLISGSVDYFLMPRLELGVLLTVEAYNANNATYSDIGLLVGPTYNFSDDVANSIFAVARVGIDMHYEGPDANNPNYNNFAYLIGVGKRFELTSHVTFRPEINFLGEIGHDVDAPGGAFHVPSSGTWQIIPLQFSIVF